MTNVEIKARQLVDRYGTEMAVMQVRFFMDGATGVMRGWWQRVLACIAPPQPAGQKLPL